VIYMVMDYATFLAAGERMIVDGIVDTSKDASGGIVAVKFNLVRGRGGELLNIDQGVI